ncbi:RHS repeat-associated core domain-containing protein [Flavobacterium agricola]|uniref:RHS repeat-associated core domain-containing protein n=1 Tax=Flavobacterium agricola TaxID=2870839 RepID=UPI002223783A|nr:RHS repeat-associated core domain-containing protein [Flavobacterium agricola]
MRVSYKYDETVVNTNNLTIVDTNNYYPFVLKHKGYGSPNQTPSYKYKYNGKELQDELGLNWYDYGARNYDAALGRWMNVDPLAEMFPSWSPYSYTFSNPVRYTDPTGMAPECDGCPDNASIGDVFDHPDYGQVTYNGQNWGNEQYGNIMNSIEITNSNNSDGTTESINQDYSLNLNPFNDYLKKYYKGPVRNIWPL